MKRLLQFSLLITSVIGVIFSCAKEEPTPEAIKYTLTVTAGDGGNVSNAGGSYAAGSEVTITATPNSEYVFSGWSNGSTDNEIKITINSNQTLIANFIKRKYALNITIEGEGTVTEEIISSGKDYDSGTVVRLTAIPKDGWAFAGWSGNIESIENPIELTVNNPILLNVLFETPNLQAVYKSSLNPFLTNSIGASTDNLNLNQHDKVLATHFSYWYDEKQLSEFNEWSAGRSYLTKDFNNDGYTDLFVSFMSSEQEYVPFKLFLYDTDSNTFKENSNLITNNIGQPFNRKSMSGDLNGDGILDIVAVSHPERNDMEFSFFDIILSNGINSWEQINIETRSRFIEGDGSGYYHGFSIGDVDQDNDIDIVMGMWHNVSEGITTYLNDGFGSFTSIRGIKLNESENREIESMSFTQELIDLNGDKCLDLIFWGKGDIVIKKGNCDGTFGPYYQQLPINYGMDYKGIDLDMDGDLDLVVLVDDYTDNQLIYIYENQSTLEAFRFIERTVLKAPKFGIGYISFLDLNSDGLLDISPSGPFIGYDDLNLKDGEINPYYPNSPFILSKGGFSFEVINYPILTPLEKIEFSADKELTWIASYPMIEEDASQPYDEGKRRGTIFNWKIYYSYSPFGDSIEPWVNSKSFDKNKVEELTDINGKTIFKLKLDDLANNGIYLRISSVDEYGIESNLSYMIQLQLKE